MPKNTRPISVADQALLDHAKAVAYFLCRYDLAWRVEIEIVPSHFVRLTTRREDKTGPSLRLPRIAMPADEQAMVIHEAAVGRTRARRDRATYKREDVYEDCAADENPARLRYNAARRRKRALDPQWRALENQKRLERARRQKERKAARQTDGSDGTNDD